MLLAASESIAFRPVQPSDRDVLQQLHEEFFPIKYSDKFYEYAVQGKGPNGAPLFSVIATNQRGEMLGFILAQFFSYPNKSEDVDLFQLGQNPEKIFYILTLGVRGEYRRFGIASLLIDRCIDYAREYIECGAIYLHVIHYNKGAMNLYQKKNFAHLRTLENFYSINNELHTAFLYIHYVNGYNEPLMTKILDSLSSATQMGLSFVQRLFSIFGFSSSPPTTPENSTPSIDSAEV